MQWYLGKQRVTKHDLYTLYPTMKTAHSHKHAHMHMYIHTHTHTYTHMYTLEEDTHTYTHMCTLEEDTHTYTHMYTCTCTHDVHTGHKYMDTM